ncbi:MAG: hypothetical protein KC618_08815, partial [Candidatus Omnitrophica bacterium]|nr:hypothetical protein [Candidatus Omnitrophota bacterium]
AKININSNGTVTFSKGWNISRNIAIDRYSVRQDGRLLSKKSLREGKTPITTLYEYDASSDSSVPAVNLYAGYPRYTTAEVVMNYKNGTNRSYYQPSNFALPWMEAYHVNKVDNVYTTIYGGQVVIPARYGEDAAATIRKATGNNVYMVFARNMLGIIDPNYQYNEKDAHVAEMMSKAKWQRTYLQQQEYPVTKLRHSFEWSELSAKAQKPEKIQAESFVENINKIRNRNTGLIPTNPGTYHHNYVSTTEVGEILSALIVAGDTRIAEELLLGDANRPVKFSFYNISTGGTQPIGSSLDINTGTPYRKGGEFRNPYPTDFMADAQVSIANASLLLWKATGNEFAKELSVNLVKTLIREFYPTSERDPSRFVGAFSEKVFEESLGGFKSRPEIYSVETNSKIYLLFNTLEQVLRGDSKYDALR